jgi:hypothetical protein
MFKRNGSGKTSLKISQGLVFALISWTLVFMECTRAAGLVTTQSSGGVEFPDFVLLEIWLALLSGIGLSALAAKLLHRKIVVIPPLGCWVGVFVILYVPFALHFG